jgi:glycosyltransferase involved in cell wall biosynthesis
MVKKMLRSFLLKFGFRNESRMHGNISIPKQSQDYLNTPIESLPNLSVIIPCYEMKGAGAIHLRRSLTSLTKQSWKNFEVVISDHSESDMIENVAKEFESELSINYVRYEKFRGSSCMNANNGISYSKYNYLKFLFQDDYLAHDRSLEKGMKYLVWSRKDWIATACNHRNDKTGDFFWNHYPRIVNGEIFNALNSLGCPSVMYFKKTDIRFDERLPALMDIDYYEQVKSIFGDPGLLYDINVTIGIHDAQVTNNGGFGDKVQVKKELEIVFEKYNHKKV